MTQHFKPRARLYYPQTLQTGTVCPLPAKTAHYLLSVLRAQRGDQVLLFNAGQGEWLAEITHIRKKEADVTLIRQTLEPFPSPDLWLVFAPLKAGRIDFLVEKATELGASELFPVNTDYTNASRVNHDRLYAHAIEAAEQTERFDIPTLHAFQPLESLLASWPQERTLLFCDESGSGVPIGEALMSRSHEKLAVLIGPEGGFSPKERDRLASLDYTLPVGLGPRILRAETAALAALACVQSSCGDWGRRPDFRGDVV